MFFSAPLWKGVIHARGVAGVLTIYYVWSVGVLFSDVVHVVPVVYVPVVPLVYVPFWSVGVLCSVWVLTKPQVGSDLSVIGSVVSVMRCVRTGGLEAAPPLLWRELPNGLCYNFIVLCDFND